MSSQSRARCEILISEDSKHMTQLDDAVTKFHRLLESPTYADLGWATALHEQMDKSGLTVSGRPVSHVLRPHFLTKRQYNNLIRASQTLGSAVTRVKKLALSNPALLQRIELLPAEKMLASVDPGYSYFPVASLPETQVQNGTLHFLNYSADVPAGLAMTEVLSDLFYDAAPVREFRKGTKLLKFDATLSLLEALLQAYKEFGGTRKPNIAIIEFRQPFESLESREFALLRQRFMQHGYTVEVVHPEMLEYRNGRLRSGEYQIDVVYRGIRAQEFLIRYDLQHPLVRAYRDRAVCMVNSFQSEIADKQALFDLLTDQEITGRFPAAERRAIQEYIPWTRMVTSTKTSYQDRSVDLPEFILKNRENLILKPNDDAGERHTVRGWESDESSWHRALRQAMRSPYVVQEKVYSPALTFPVYQWGQMEMREMNVEVHPHLYLGKMNGCSSYVTEARNGGFSMASGLAPTFLLEGK